MISIWLLSPKKNHQDLTQIRNKSNPKKTFRQTLIKLVELLYRLENDQNLFQTFGVIFRQTNPATISKQRRRPSGYTSLKNLDKDLLCKYRKITQYYLTGCLQSRQRFGLEINFPQENECLLFLAWPFLRYLSGKGNEPDRSKMKKPSWKW